MVKFEYLRGYKVLREVSMRMERVLRWDKGSIFHLDPREMFILHRDPERFAKLAAERREKYEAEKDLFVRPVIFSDRLYEATVPEVSEDANVLRGIGVTNAVMEGEVVVVRSPNDQEAIAALRPGSVLVTVTTDPAWSPILAIVGRTGGLVTEVGGLLAHGAIYAREMGIAAVLNVPGAAKILQNGMRVRVNARDGHVEILK
jgi:pyruvate,water dikinase